MSINPTDNHDVYDYFTLAGRKSPGCLVPGSLNPKRSEGWDAQKADGKNGAALVHKGAAPVKFSAQIQLWKDPSKSIDHFAAWDKWKDVLKTSSDPTNQQSLEIYHPLCAEINLTAVVVTDWGPPIPTGRGGISIATIEFLEDLKLATANTGKPGGTKSKSNGGGTQGKQKEERPDPNAEKKRQLQQRQQTLKDLNG